MKVLVSDPLVENAIQKMRAAGLDVTVKTGLKPDQLKKEIPPFEAIAIRSGTKMTAEIIQAATHLKLIARAGVGLDNVDVMAAQKKKIQVENTPFATTHSVAEHTIALMLALVRNIPQADASLRRGEWNRKAFEGIELKEKVLAIIGLGRIGQEVTKRAKAFGMTVFANDRLTDAEVMAALDIEHRPLFDVMEIADIVSIHVPLHEGTYHFFDYNLMSKMKKGSYLINASRGGIVDEKALYRLLQEGHLAGAALDVFEEEPPQENPLLKLSNVVAVPHLGASTKEGQDRAGEEVAEIIIRFAQQKS